MNIMTCFSAARFGAVVVTCAVVLSACSSSSVPSSQVPATPTNVSGQYTGTAHDSVSGNATSSLNLSQTGTSLGGDLILTFSATNTIAAVTTLAYNQQTQGLAGTAVATIGTATCTFSVIGTYNPSTAAIAGSYTATNNCSGENGTYNGAAQCFYVETLSTDRRRPLTGGIVAC